jgi:hypothetical protein
MREAVLSLLSSKKFVTALIAVIAGVAAKVGIPEARVEELVAIVSPLLVYIGAQGFADRAKPLASLVWTNGVEEEVVSRVYGAEDRVVVEAAARDHLLRQDSLSGTEKYAAGRLEWR